MVPGPWRRLWRDRPRLVAVGLLALTAIAASTLQSTAAIVLRATLDEGWRGPYDILVTQAGKDPLTDGMLRTDATVDADAGRLSLEDLAFIRSLPGVEVAAPVALVAFSASDSLGGPSVWVPVPVGEGASLTDPEAYRVTVSSVTTDTTGQRALADQTATALAYVPFRVTIDVGPDGLPAVMVRPTQDAPALLNVDGTRIPTAGGYQDGAIALGLSTGPRPAATVVLIDPEAERALLGDAGAFLDPLVEYEGERSPLLVLQREPAELPMRVVVERLEGVEPGRVSESNVIPPRLPNDAEATVVAEYEFDGSALLDPFAPTAELLGGLVAADVAEFDPGAPGYVPRSVLGGRYLVEDDAVRLMPRGYAWYRGYSQAPLSGAAPAGAVTDYAKLFGTVGSISPSASGIGEYAEVVGTFDAGQVLAGALGRAPLGGYEVPTPAVGGAELPTSLTGFGVPGTNPLAIGSFDALTGLQADRPISAIRIRVAGIDAYTPQAQERLLQAAGALQRLGYHATIVAGSSPQPVPVTVADYALAEAADDGRQMLGDLGVIEQQWSRLGAVVEADAAVSATSVALLVACVLAVGLLLATVQLARVPVRRDTAAVLRRAGWRRGRVIRWFLAEDALALGVLAIVGAASTALATVPLLAAAAVGAAMALVAGTALVAVIVGSRPPRVRPRPPRGGAPAISSPLRLGLRRARSGIGGSVALGVAVALIVVSVALAATAFVQGRELAGPTQLGAVASMRAWIPQGVLAGLTLIAAIVLAVLARRLTLSRAREQFAALRAMGWDTAAVSRMQRAELAVTALPGLLVGLGLAAAVAVQLPALTLPVLAAAVTGGVLALIVVFLAARRVD